MSRPLTDSMVRVSLCVKDPQKAASLCEKMAGAKDIVLWKALWDQPALAWGADAVLLDGEDIAVFQKALSSAGYCPAVLVETSSAKSAEEVAALLGRAPFATFSSGISQENLREMVAQAAAHSRLSYTTWYQAHKADTSESTACALAPEPALPLESLLSWFKNKQPSTDLYRALGEMFERWSGSPRVLMMVSAGQPVQARMQIVYHSKTVEAETAKCGWLSTDPLWTELEKQNVPTAPGPQVFRWTKVLNVRCMLPLKFQDALMGVLAFADRPGEATYTAKDLQAMQATAAKVGQLLYLERHAKSLPLTPKEAAAGAPVTPVSKEILRKQQLEIIGRMALRSSHELKNCLVSIRTFTQLFPEKYADEQFRKDFYQVVSKEVERLNGLVEKLLFFAGPVQLKFSQEKITDLISEALALFGTEDFRNVQLHKVFGHKHPTLWLDRQQMLAVFFNILQNSLQALGNGGKLVVVTEDHPHPDFPEGVLVVRFLDTGRGMALKDPDEPFEPFYSTKARGMGLGLTIAKRIVEEHGGTIRLDSSKDKGTEVILCLPRSIPHWEMQAAQSTAGVSDEHS